MNLRIKNFLGRIKRRLINQRQISDFAAIERCERIFYLNYLREGMTVFDVGANVGELTLLFSRFVGESGKVHAFEACGEVFQKLEIICRAAGRRNAALNHLALSDRAGTIRLNIYDENYSAFNSQAERPLKNYGLDLEAVGVEEVPATTIDEYCGKNKIEQIDLLKIDVEGAELQVLRGAAEMFKTGRIACVSFEFGQTTFDMGNKPAEIKDFFQEKGYKISNIVEGNSVFSDDVTVETAQYSMFIAAPEKK